MKTRKHKHKKGGSLKDVTTEIKNIKNFKVIPNDMEIQQKSDQIYSSYLENVNIDMPVKMLIMEHAFKSSAFFHKMYENIRDYLPTKSKKSWEDCINDCFYICNKYSNYEISTTAYMLRALSNSLIGDSSYQLSFTVLEDKLTGYWENDQYYIKMESTNPSILHHGRLIMGFGPSSSGKTYCANKIIDLMTSIDPSFPKLLLTIDGSIYRQSSVVYQCILEEIKQKELYDGISNLVSSSVFGKKSIFSTDLIKKIIKQYLKNQKKHGFISNLYVPETLGGCIGHINCKMKISDYIQITGDHNWIGLMIYQHTTPDKCPYHEQYKCTGTVPSGTSRELVEGKKYSSKAWELSYQNGKIYMKKAPNFRFMIHNSGNPDKTSIFQDLSVDKLAMSQTTIQFFKDNNWLYIDGDIKKYPKCHLFRKNCSYI
jgi:hypothetical protein